MTGEYDYIRMNLKSGKTEFICLKCGEIYEPRLPCSFGMITAIMNQFLEEHKGCKEKENSK